MKVHEIKVLSDNILITPQRPDSSGFNAMITEELHKYLTTGVKQNSVDEAINAACDIAVFSISEIYKYGVDATEIFGAGDIIDWLPNAKPSELSYCEQITVNLGEFINTTENGLRVQELVNMIALSYNQVVELGYHPDKCMYEVMKKLNSITGAYSDTTKNWQKFKTPEAISLWYSSDFSECGLPGQTVISTIGSANTGSIGASCGTGCGSGGCS